MLVVLFSHTVHYSVEAKSVARLNFLFVSFSPSSFN